MNLVWSPKAIQRWSALFQSFDLSQHCSALIQKTEKIPILIRAVSEVIASYFLLESALFRALQHCLKGIMFESTQFNADFFIA